MKIHDLMRVLKHINPEIQIEVNDLPIRRIGRTFNDKREMRIVLYSYNQVKQPKTTDPKELFPESTTLDDSDD